MGLGEARAMQLKGLSGSRRLEGLSAEKVPEWDWSE